MGQIIDYTKENTFRNVLNIKTLKMVDEDCFFTPTSGIVTFAGKVDFEIEPLFKVKGREVNLLNILQTEFIDDDVKGPFLVVGLFTTFADKDKKLRIPYSGTIYEEFRDPLNYLEDYSFRKLKHSMKGLEEKITGIIQPKAASNIKELNEEMEYLFNNERIVHTITVPQEDITYYVVTILDSPMDTFLSHNDDGSYNTQNFTLGEVNGERAHIFIILPLYDLPVKAVVKPFDFVEKGISCIIEFDEEGE